MIEKPLVLNFCMKRHKTLEELYAAHFMEDGCLNHMCSSCSCWTCSTYFHTGTVPVEMHSIGSKIGIKIKYSTYQNPGELDADTRTFSDTTEII